MVLFLVLNLLLLPPLRGSSPNFLRAAPQVPRGMPNAYICLETDIVTLVAESPLHHSDISLESISTLRALCIWYSQGVIRHACKIAHREWPVSGRSSHTRCRALPRHAPPPRRAPSWLLWRMLTRTAPSCILMGMEWAGPAPSGNPPPSKKKRREVPFWVGPSLVWHSPGAVGMWMGILRLVCGWLQDTRHVDGGLVTVPWLPLGHTK